MAKRALVVGLDTYLMSTGLDDLDAAAQDASDVADLLAHHHDQSENWDVVRVVEDGPGLPTRDAGRVQRDHLRDTIHAFFAEPEHGDTRADEDLLFYFAGHAVRGRAGTTDLMAADGAACSFGDLMTSIGAARARTTTVILDCCTSGALGGLRNRDPFVPDFALLPENVTILTASRSGEEAWEDARRGGLFSDRLKGGLQGAAADLLGNVTALSLYSHATAAFPPDGDQRPTFKSHAVKSGVLRRSEPAIPIERLLEITTIFDPATAQVVLTESHEGVESDEGWIDRNAVDRQPYTGSAAQIELDHLKAYRDSHLVRSDDKRDFWFLCKDVDPARSTVSLTPLGRYFHDQVKAGLIGPESGAPAS